MPERKQIDWDAVQRDRDRGVPVSELVKTYGVSNPTIYTKTHESNGNGHAGGATKTQPQKRQARFLQRSQGEIDAWNQWVSERPWQRDDRGLVDAIWNGLPLASKAALLGKLQEI